MNVKKMILAGLLAVAVIGGIVLAVVSNMSPSGEASPTAAPTTSSSPSVTSVPIPDQTFGPEPIVPSVAPSPTATKASPSPSPTASSSGVPVVAPNLKPIEMDGFGSSKALESSYTAEELKVQETIFKVIPVAANEASSKYKSPLGARDELVKQSLITDNMAKTWFLPEFTPFEKDLNKTGFTVQTTGLKCLMRTVSPQTALELGKVTCYFTRHYVDQKGGKVSDNEFVKATGGAGSIDPDQISRVEVGIKKEGGAWKVDDLQFN